MQIPPRITFISVDSSPALEARIHEKIDKLDQRFPDLLGLAVAVDSVHQNQQKGILYSVRIEVTLPGGQLVVSHHPGKNPIKHEKIFAAMNDAFSAIEKQIARFKEIERRDVKLHEPHWLEGEVSQIFFDEDYGFLTQADGPEVYFHRNAVENEKFDDLEIGNKAKFVIAEGEGRKGPQATIVRPF